MGFKARNNWTLAELAEHIEALQRAEMKSRYERLRIFLGELLIPNGGTK